MEPKEPNGPLSSGSRGGPRPMMIWLPLEKIANAAGSALAIHDRGSSGVAAPRHRFTLRLALPLHPINYVRYQFLFLLPLLLPVWTFANIGRGLASLLVAGFLAVLVVFVVRMTGT